uniref:Uncharacterized protein n=1 Tax=Setaria digitata TaxID=48799 RepID=A0A915PBE9_9BILA
MAIFLKPQLNCQTLRKVIYVGRVLAEIIQLARRETVIVIRRSQSASDKGAIHLDKNLTCSAHCALYFFAIRTMDRKERPSVLVIEINCQWQWDACSKR